MKYFEIFLEFIALTLKCLFTLYRPLRNCMYSYSKVLSYDKPHISDHNWSQWIQQWSSMEITTTGTKPDIKLFKIVCLK